MTAKPKPKYVTGINVTWNKTGVNVTFICRILLIWGVFKIQISQTSARVARRNAQHAVGAGYVVQRKALRPRSRLISCAAGSEPIEADPQVDFGAIARYIGATAFQWGAMVGALHVLQLATNALAASPSAPVWASKVVVTLFFWVVSIKSGIFSPLDNSRPAIIDKDGKKMMMEEIKRPAWMPPPLTFPIVWNGIGVLRTISSVLIWESLNRTLVVVPLAAMMLDLAIGDIWNTINNKERRRGTAVIAAGFVWTSAVVVTYLYLQTCPVAGMVLAPSLLWFCVALCLVYSTWALNGREGMIPMTKKK